ncbi:hypothetical protein EDC04DRAFT_2615759 [Pisolithus marmoratus]|nr:hypothetical protein EDC04DRAFT_2615759 [Pisolithus marmoratus]
MSRVYLTTEVWTLEFLEFYQKGTSTNEGKLSEKEGPGTVHQDKHITQSILKPWVSMTNPTDVVNLRLHKRGLTTEPSMVTEEFTTFFKPLCSMVNKLLRAVRSSWSTTDDAHNYKTIRDIFLEGFGMVKEVPNWSGHKDVHGYGLLKGNAKHKFPPYATAQVMHAGTVFLSLAEQAFVMSSYVTGTESMHCSSRMTKGSGSQIAQLHNIEHIQTEQTTTSKASHASYLEVTTANEPLNPLAPVKLKPKPKLHMKMSFACASSGSQLPRSLQEPTSLDRASPPTYQAAVEGSSYGFHLAGSDKQHGQDDVTTAPMSHAGSIMPMSCGGSVAPTSSQGSVVPTVGLC